MDDFHNIGRQLNYCQRTFRAEQGRRGWRADPAQARGRAIELVFKNGSGQPFLKSDQIETGLQGTTNI